MENSTGSKGVTFIGIRTAKMAEMADFFVNVLGYPRTHSEPDFVAFRTPTGQRIELFSKDYAEKRHFITGPVVGFEVEDFESSVQWLRDNKIEILEEPTASQSGTRWVHFRGADGNVYEFVNHPDLNGK